MGTSPTSSRVKISCRPCSTRYVVCQRSDDPRHPLPHYRVGGKILVRRSEFDAWIAAYRQVGDTDVDRIVAAVMAELN